MESFLKADIFFFISSVVAVILGILVSILLVYLIKVVKNVHALSETLKNNMKDGKAFVEELKERLERNVLFRFFFPSARNNRARSKNNESTKNS